MTDSANQIHEVLLSQLTQIDLDPDDFETAFTASEQVPAGTAQWQTYIQTLAMVGFSDWLQARLDTQSIVRQLHTHPSTNYLQVGPFQIALITSERVFDGIVDLPQPLVDHASLAAHFYVVLEVFEEQAMVFVRGFMRHDQLLSESIRTQIQTSTDGFYQLPLSCFEPEPSLLLSSLKHLDPAAILPESAPETVTVELQDAVSAVPGLTNLGGWLQEAWDDSWQAIEALLSPSANYAYATRNLSEAKRGKRLELGLQLGQQSVALILTITKTSDTGIGVLVQLIPTEGEQCLPAQLKLAMLSETGEVLQSVQSRTFDNLIQLRPFSGERGDLFCIEVNLNDVTHTEEFEL